MAVPYFTPVQAATHRVLAYAIANARDHGLDVPCLADPVTWDQAATDPQVCAGCPVLRQCAIYANTGAVEHGIIAGRRAQPRGTQTATPDAA